MSQIPSLDPSLTRFIREMKPKMQLNISILIHNPLSNYNQYVIKLAIMGDQSNQGQATCHHQFNQFNHTIIMKYISQIT